MIFIIDAEPVGKGRPRYSARGGFVHTYTPEKTRNFEDFVRASYEKYMSKWPRIDPGAPKSVKIVCLYGLPKNTPKKRILERLAAPVLKKPDIDNVVKIILDALNGVAWGDDKQIIDLSVTRMYALEGRIIVEINDIDDIRMELLRSRVLGWVTENGQ